VSIVATGESVAMAVVAIVIAERAGVEEFLDFEKS